LTPPATGAQLLPHLRCRREEEGGRDHVPGRSARGKRERERERGEWLVCNKGGGSWGRAMGGGLLHFAARDAVVAEGQTIVVPSSF
jgi:hypothetical protein